MPTIYVYDNETIDDDINSAEPIDQHTATTDVECLAWFDAHYNGNDYTASFAAPAGQPAQLEKNMIEFGVVYYPSGAHRECANEAQAREAFARAPQPDDQEAVLIVNGAEVERREPDA